MVLVYVLSHNYFTLFMKCWQMTSTAMTPSPSIKSGMTLMLEDAVRNKLSWI